MSKFKEAMPLTINWCKNLRSDGELTVMRITQGDQEIQLTLAQMEGLLVTLKHKIPDAGSAK